MPLVLLAIFVVLACIALIPVSIIQRAQPDGDDVVAGARLAAVIDVDLICPRRLVDVARALDAAARGTGHDVVSHAGAFRAHAGAVIDVQAVPPPPAVLDPAGDGKRPPRICQPPTSRDEVLVGRAEPLAAADVGVRLRDDDVGICRRNDDVQCADGDARARLWFPCATAVALSTCVLNVPPVRSGSPTVHPDPAG